jgi:ABC transporter ATM
MFDEATSALDANTEGQLLLSIKDFAQEHGCTSLFIAHRLRTIMDSDLIVVLDKLGNLVQQGTHSELLKDCESTYAIMWQEQNASGKHEHGENCIVGMSSKE